MYGSPHENKPHLLWAATWEESSWLDDVSLDWALESFNEANPAIRLLQEVSICFLWGAGTDVKIPPCFDVVPLKGFKFIPRFRPKILLATSISSRFGSSVVEVCREESWPSVREIRKQEKMKTRVNAILTTQRKYQVLSRFKYLFLPSIIQLDFVNKFKLISDSEPHDLFMLLHVMLGFCFWGTNSNWRLQRFPSQSHCQGCLWN